MKSLDELDRLGHIVDDAKLEKVNGGSDWRNSANTKRWLKFLQGIGNIAEAASHLWG